MTDEDLTEAAEAIGEMDNLQRIALGPNASVGRIRQAVVRRQVVQSLLDRVIELQAEVARLTPLAADARGVVERMRAAAGDVLRRGVIPCHHPRCTAPALWIEEPTGGYRIPTVCDEHKHPGDTYTEDEGAPAIRALRAALEASPQGVATALERLQADYDELDEAARAVLDHVDRGGHALTAAAGALQGVLYAHAHPEEVKQVAAALAGQAKGDPRFPSWFVMSKHGDSALLYACAHAGMTAEQALDELAKESAQRLAHMQKLLMLQPPAPIVIERPQLMQPAGPKEDP